MPDNSGLRLRDNPGMVRARPELIREERPKWVGGSKPAVQLEGGAEHAPTLTDPRSLPPAMRALLFGDEGQFGPLGTPRPSTGVGLNIPTRLEAEILQSGDHTFSARTARRLNGATGLQRSKEDWGAALESLKKESSLPPAAILAISARGDVFDGDRYVANLEPYLLGKSSGHRDQSRAGRTR